MSALETYIDGVLQNRGLLRMNALRNLRQYINASQTTTLTASIHQIREIPKLKILIEAGIGAYLQQIVTTQADKIASGYYTK